MRSLLEAVDQNGGARIRESSLRDMGLEAARVRRYFLREFGMTFQAYCRARRLGQAFVSIRDGAPSTTLSSTPASIRTAASAPPSRACSANLPAKIENARLHPLSLD